MGLSEGDNSTSTEVSTFLVSIYFRQNASWQGTVQWLDGRKTVTFRSAAELAMLMLEAVKNSKGASIEYQQPVWVDKQEVS